MNCFIRLVLDASPWLASGEQTADETLAEKPIWLFRDFMPTIADDNELSLYHVRSEAELDAVISAFLIHKDHKKTVPTLSFAMADADRVIDAGFQVTYSLGQLKHTIADNLHLTVQLKTLSQLERLARIFLEGEVKQRLPTIDKAAYDFAIRNIQFDFAAVAQKPDTTASRNLLKAVRERDVNIAKVDG